MPDIKIWTAADRGSTGLPQPSEGGSDAQECACRDAYGIEKNPVSADNALDRLSSVVGNLAILRDEAEDSQKHRGGQE